MSITAFILFCAVYGLFAACFGWGLCLKAKRGDEAMTNREAEGREQVFSEN